MKNIDWTEILVPIGLVLFIPFLVLIIMGLMGLQNNYTCHRYSRFTHLQTRTGWPAACYVKTPNGQWITIDNYVVYGDKK